VDAVAGPERAVLVQKARDAERHAHFLASVVAMAIRHEKESRAFGIEIGERYEEITLLYSISEILGSVISLEQAAGTILEEVAEALDVQRAALWLHDPEKHRLELVASYGSPGPTQPIDIDDEASIAAAAFRERMPINFDPDQQIEKKHAAPE